VNTGPVPGTMNPARRTVRAWVDLGRPFTLVAPALGFLSGGLTAIGAAPREAWTPSLLVAPLIGSAMAACLNAGNNALNQIYDLDIDRVNKPKRPLPSGRLSVADTWVFTFVTYVAALILAWLVAPGGRHQCFWLVAIAVVCTFLYSVPPFRTKRLGIWANVTIAIPRGVLLKVAGWAMVARVGHAEPWYLGAVIGIFLIGASSTKDFADIAGDRAGGCKTLPILHGVRKAAWIISPFFVFPWLLLPLGARLRDPQDPTHAILTGNPILLSLLGALLAAWGIYTVYLLVRDPASLAETENHPSWRHMYLMMMAAQVGVGLAYVF
jgi:4-hydroxybenzoate polyprenyltransferase